MGTNRASDDRDVDRRPVLVPANCVGPHPLTPGDPPGELERRDLLFGGNDQLLEGAAARLLLGVTEAPGELRIDAEDTIAGIDDGNALGDAREELVEVGSLALAGGLLLPAPGDVLDDCEDVAIARVVAERRELDPRPGHMAGAVGKGVVDLGHGAQPLDKLAKERAISWAMLGEGEIAVRHRGQLRRPVAEHAPQGRVGMDDRATAVQHHDPLRGMLDEGAAEVTEPNVLRRVGLDGGNRGRRGTHGCAGRTG